MYNMFRLKFDRPMHRNRSFDTQEIANFELRAMECNVVHCQTMLQNADVMVYTLQSPGVKFKCGEIWV